MRAEEIKDTEISSRFGLRFSIKSQHYWLSSSDSVVFARLDKADRLELYSWNCKMANFTVRSRVSLAAIVVDRANRFRYLNQFELITVRIALIA